MPPTAQASHVQRGLLHPGYGPLLRIVLHHRDSPAKGNTHALLDTGASMSAVDKDLAASLGLPSPGYATWKAVTQTEEEHASALREGGVQFWGNRWVYPVKLVELPALAHRVEGYTVGVLLGWDFLQNCKLTCDGPANTFTLELPKHRTQRRR